MAPEDQDTRAGDGDAVRPGLILLGPPRLIGAGVRPDLPDRAFGLLAYLAMQPGHAARRDTIRALLWGDSEPAKANDSLRQLLSRLRRIQAETGLDLVVFRGDVLHLADEAVAVDLVAFDDADPLDWLRARDAGKLKAWLSLYGGDLLATSKPATEPFDAWLVQQRERLRERFLAVAGEILDDADLLGDDDLLGLAMRVRTVEPASDQACRAAMHVHARRGSPQAARRTYDAYRRALKADYDIEPNPRTRELARGLGVLAGETAPAAAPAGEEAAVAARGAGAPEGAVPDAPVRLDPRPPEPTAPARPGSAEPQPARARACPRIMILPPLTILKDDETLALARAFIEDVTVGLSRYRSFTIIAPHTARAMALGGATDEDYAARGGADFVVHTALKPTPRGLAMTFRLSDLVENGVVSVSEVDWHPDNLTAVFGHLVRKVVHALVDAIEKTTLLLPASSPDASAYRLYLEGRKSLTSIDLPNIRRAKKWFRDASARAQAYASPVIGLARATIMEWFVLGMPADASLTEALRLADRGLTLDPLDWRGLREKALGSLWLRRHDDCLALFEEALALGPNDADLIADYADALAHCGEPERGLEMHDRAMGLNPLHPDYYVWIKGSILFQTHQYEKALETMRPLRSNPATSRLLAACAARAGRATEARSYARILREVYPDFSAESLWRISPNRRREDTAHFVDALKLAGVG